jgi:hypothetical protein
MANERSSPHAFAGHNLDSHGVTAEIATLARFCFVAKFGMGLAAIEEADHPNVNEWDRTRLLSASREQDAVAN